MAWCSLPRAVWVADNPARTTPWSVVLRLPLRASSLLAAAALAGAIVYWRANDRQRSRKLAEDIDTGIAEGRRAAGELLHEAGDEQPTV